MHAAPVILSPAARCQKPNSVGLRPSVSWEPRCLAQALCPPPSPVHTTLPPRHWNVCCPDPAPLCADVTTNLCLRLAHPRHAPRDRCTATLVHPRRRAATPGPASGFPARTACAHAAQAGQRVLLPELPASPAHPCRGARFCRADRRNVCGTAEATAPAGISLASPCGRRTCSTPLDMPRTWHDSLQVHAVPRGHHQAPDAWRSPR